MTALTARSPEGTGRDWEAIRTVVGKDLRAVRRSKAIVIPMIALPVVLLVALPLALGSLARSIEPGSALSSPLLHGLLDAVVNRPEAEQLPVLILGYLLSPLLLVIPLMVSAVLAADAFAGEKERRTLESLLLLPMADRDLFTAKVLSAFVPALALSWSGGVLYALVADLTAWPVAGAPILPFAQWLVMLLFVAPGMALLALSLLVLVSSRARTTQEANQLGGAVILPLIFIAASQVSTTLLAPVPVVIGVGAVVWIAAALLLRIGSRRFTRDRLARTA